MPKDDSFYEDHTNRLWARWERENALVFYDTEEEERHEQELQALRDQELREQRARRELEQERMRRWQLLHPPKPPPSSDEEDDITFEELEDAVTQLDLTGAMNWNSLTARTREPQRSHATPVSSDSDEEARYEMEEQQTSSRPDPIDSSQQTERSALRVPAWGVELDALRPVLDRLLRSFPVRQHNPPMVQPSPPAWQFNQPRRKLNFSTKHGRRQHQQDLRRARANRNRKADRNELSRPTQPVVQSNSAFVFAPPTAPAFTVPATSGVFVFGRSTLTGMEFTPSPSSSLSSSSFSTFSTSLTFSNNSSNSINSSTSHQRSAGLGTDQLWGATQSTTLESDTKIDRVAGQSSSLSLTAARINQRPRQLHDVSPHVSLLHQIGGSEPARGLKPRGASHRPDPTLMSTSLSSTHTPPGTDGAASVSDRGMEAPHTHLPTTPREREDMLHHTPDPSALDDSSVDDSERASAASTIPMLASLLSFWLARRSGWPRQRGRKARDLRRGAAHGQLLHFFSSRIESGEHHRQPRRHGSRCTRALMKAHGRSRWLNGLCRCLHSGCTDGTGPRPSIEP
jgi:hypothetical protein